MHTPSEVNAANILHSCVSFWCNCVICLQHWVQSGGSTWVTCLNYVLRGTISSPHPAMNTIFATNQGITCHLFYNEQWRQLLLKVFTVRMYVWYPKGNTWNSFLFVPEAVEVLLQTLNIPVTGAVHLINTLAPSVTSCPTVPVLLSVLLVESYQHNKILEHEPFHKALLNAILNLTVARMWLY